MWSLKIPPRIQVSLWLFTKNKIMNRENLSARSILKPLECELCKEYINYKAFIFIALLLDLFGMMYL
jgi:hypothetical protein